jgi:3-oxoacyl-[acyl-carrier-protein] synthase-3
MRLHTGVSIIGWGNVASSPECAYDNERVLSIIEQNLVAAGRSVEAEKIATFTSQSVTDKLGIRERQYRFGAEQALASAAQNDPDFDRSKIHLIISGGSTPDDLYPSCAANLQHLLGIKDAEAFDVSAACSSGSQAVIEAVRALQVGCDTYALVAVGEVVGSTGNNREDEDSLIWGDGGGAVVLQAGVSLNRSYGVLNFRSRTDGSLAKITRSRGIGSHPDHRSMPLSPSMEGQGRRIYRWVVTDVAEQLKQFIVDSKITINSRTFLLPHNGNLKMVMSLAEDVGIPSEQVLTLIPTRGNQSSASVLATLAEYANHGYFQHDDQLILATFGGGVIYNFLLYRW